MKLFLSIVVCELVGLIGAVFTAPSIEGWYMDLVKPPLNPPAWVFGPAWTILYALMGIAAFVVWQKGLKQKKVRVALGLFFVQLALNGAWSFIFFGAHRIGFALIEIVALWIAILCTIIAFAKCSKRAAWLMAPYLAWVSFAVYLNAVIWVLN